jgi:hypothetical protein
MTTTITIQTDGTVDVERGGDDAALGRRLRQALAGVDVEAAARLAEDNGAHALAGLFREAR